MAGTAGRGSSVHAVSVMFADGFLAVNASSARESVIIDPYRDPAVARGLKLPLSLRLGSAGWRRSTPGARITPSSFLSISTRTTRLPSMWLHVSGLPLAFES